ncbi:MAG: sel1 repeat family protein, partial [Planctomycetes bacterium]|nr:sel1 repeat family protein [Planctomycetota bacterium]
MPHPWRVPGARLARPVRGGHGAGVDDPERRYREAKALIAAGDAAGRGALERLAQEGHPAACCRLAEMLQAEGRPGAAALLARAAAADHPRACFLLGLLHAHGGDGLGADRAAALRWCERAARLGSAEAQFNLGLLHGEQEGDEEEAGRWLQLAAANGVAEAEACLDLLWQEAGDPGARPRTWDEAETRASVALARTDPDAPKSLRFAEYYVDPCLDLLARRMKLRRDQGEDIVQQFFLELEEPLSKGEHRGRPWKESLRSRFDPG